MKYYFILFTVLSIGCDAPLEFSEAAKINHPYKNSNQIQEEILSSNEPWRFQAATWEHSFIGNYQESLEQWDKSVYGGLKMDSSQVQEFLKTYEPYNAIKHISSISESQNVVIINEAHHQPLHRVFTTQLLKSLYNNGYRYLGLETLSHMDAELNQRKYPIYKTGDYSIEPQFGNLIREALEIGFTIFPYEEEVGGEREIEQATNIINQIKKDSTAKYIIHCGWDHGVEGNYPAWGKAMAGRLKEMSSIDPLTINQTLFTESSAEKHNHQLLNEIELTESSVFLNKKGESFKNPKDDSWHDIMIFHPKTELKHGRPSWLFKEKSPVKINLTAVELATPYLAMAFKANEDLTECVPSDIVEVSGNKKEIRMALTKGKYIIYLDDNNISLSSTIEVE